jgi:hypothetical protein
MKPFQIPSQPNSYISHNIVPEWDEADYSDFPVRTNFCEEPEVEFAPLPDEQQSGFRRAARGNPDRYRWRKR